MLSLLMVATLLWGGCISCPQFFMFPTAKGEKSCCQKNGQCERPSKTAPLDQPEVVAMAIPHERMQRVAGNFFEDIPVEADAYILRNIIHDWNDEDALSILKTLRRATRPTARVMLIEWLIPETPEFNFGKWTDMSMMAAVGGRERTRADFEKLFSQSGFELDDVVATASTFTIIVGRPSL